MKRISVQDIMTRKVISTDQNSTMDKVTKLMSEKKIGSVVILDGANPTGIITVRHILKLAEACQAPVSLSAKDIMTHPIITISPDANLRAASILMLQRGIKKLAVVENNKLVGLVTTTDIEHVFIPFDSPFEMLHYGSAAGLSDRQEFQIDMEHKLVEEIMTKEVKTVHNLMKVNEIAKIMNHTKIGSLIVTKNEKPIGIVTDLQIVRDIMNLGLDPCIVTAEEAMDVLITIGAKATLKSSVEEMVKNKVRKLGVIDSNQSLVGIITTTDFLVYYRSLLFRQKTIRKI